MWKEQTQTCFRMAEKTILSFMSAEEKHVLLCLVRERKKFSSSRQVYGFHGSSQREGKFLLAPWSNVLKECNVVK